MNLSAGGEQINHNVPSFRREGTSPELIEAGAMQKIVSIRAIITPTVIIYQVLIMSLALG